MSLDVNRSVDHELIELRAYEIYQERNGGSGSEVEDWLRAERELLGSSSENSTSSVTSPDTENTAMHNVAPISGSGSDKDKFAKNQRAKATKAGA